MAEWYCNKDKVKMEEAELTLRYLSITQRVPGIRCPKCGTGYLLEKTVMTTVKDAETILEEK
jgi:hypothetical protein